MRRTRHQRKPLIKMKNGRHRVAAQREVDLQRALTSSEARTLYLQRLLSGVSQRLDAVLKEGASGALPPEIRQRAVDDICNQLTQNFGEEIGRAFCKAAERPYDRGFVLDALVRRRQNRISDFNLERYTEKSIILRGYLPSFEWNFECEVPR
jgi:hypothetical protein